MFEITALQNRRTRVQFTMGSLRSFIDIQVIFLVTLWPLRLLCP